MKWLEPYSGPLFALLRIVSGLLFACHGAQKLFGVLGGHVATGDPLTLAAGIIELVGGALILIGLFTGPVAFLCSGEMAVAYFKAHAPHGFWPIMNHGELSAIYCFLFLYMASHGAGPWSLDSMLRKKKP